MPSRGQWVTPSNNRQTWTLTKSLSARRLARSDEPRIEPGACTVPSMVMKTFVKKDYPLPNIRRYLEPGPILLVSSARKEKTNIMTMGLTKRWSEPLTGAQIYFQCLQHLTAKHSSLPSAVAQLGLVRRHPH